MQLADLLEQVKRKMKQSQETKIVERDLPQALRSIGISLNMNLPFEKALQNVAAGGHGYVSTALRDVLSKARHAGLSIPQALQTLNEKYPSRDVKRTILHLTNAYEQGSTVNNEDGNTLLRLAKEMSDKQKILIKEYSGKIMLYSLLFIVASAVLPALFQVFLLVGSNVLDLSIQPQDAFITIAVVFPLINTAIIALIKFKTPAILKG
ncbi:MAG: type II secretion system F family protein [Candidatus Diapherotrites archaeon]|nr:type II secretion system F family protein [Candidatus Diapherotrites archaeon]